MGLTELTDKLGRTTKHENGKSVGFVVESEL